MSKAAELIPASVQSFAKEFTALAAKHGLREAYAKVSFGFRSDREWDEPVHIVWEAGRHDEDAKRFEVSTTLTLRGDLSKRPAGDA